MSETFERFHRPVLHYAYKLTGDLERAREMTQETFLRLLQQDPNKINTRVAQWLFTVCRNLVLDAHKKQGREPFQFADDRFVSKEHRTVQSKLEIKEAGEQILALIEGLPPRQQEVIRLRFQNEFSYKEIAEITGLSVSNVGFLMHNGLKQLRSAYEKATGQRQACGGLK